MQLSFSLTQFEQSLARLGGRDIPAILALGMAKAAMRLLNDAVMEDPSVPIYISEQIGEEGTAEQVGGTLRGSGSAFVNNELVMTSPHGTQGQANTDHQDPIATGEVVVVVGFNTDYAAYLHEGQRMDGSRVVKNWSNPGSGAKFLENKLAENRDVYIAIVAEHLEAESNA